MKTKISIFAITLVFLSSLFSVYRILSITATLQKPGTCFVYKGKTSDSIIKLERTYFNNWDQHLYEYKSWSGNEYRSDRYGDNSIRVERLLELYPYKIECPKEEFGPWPKPAYDY